MGQPVVHFEIIGADPAGLRGFFGDLFGWEFDTSGTVAEEVSEPDDYGFIELLTTDDGTGIRGGVGGGKGDRHERLPLPPDVGEALSRAEQLGGQRMMGPVVSPNGLVVGHFTDPEGNLIGVAGPR